MTISRKPFGLILYALALILSGIIMTIYSVCGLLGGVNPCAILNNIPFHQYLFYYTTFPIWSLPLILSLRLGIAIVQILTGISLLRLQAWALLASRGLTISFLAFTFLNPFYPDYLTTIFVLWYAIFLLYCYHPRIENLCQVRAPKERTAKAPKPVEKSRLTILLGCFEIFAGLGLLRVCLWEIPLSGISLNFMTNLLLSLDITIPKIVCLLFSIGVFATGIFTISFRPVGRMLNIIFCEVAFLLACGGVFVISQPRFNINKILFETGIIFTLFASVTIFFLLTNPRVKEQFRGYQRSRRFGRLLGVLGLGIFCIAVFFGMQWSMRYYPTFFDRTSIANIVNQTQQWDNSPYKQKLLKINDGIADLFRSTRGEKTTEK